MANILACGVATIDLVQVVNDYPGADDEVRADDQFFWRGGNATNTLSVLSQFGHDVSWLGTLADDDLASVICADLDNHRVSYQHCPRHTGTTTPTSHITLTRSSASRCIVHYRALPELTLEECMAVDLTEYDWLHVEGRNVEVTRQFLENTRKHFPALPVSLEIEKPRDNIEALIPMADYVLFSRHYAQAKNHGSAEALLKAMAAEQHKRVHVCAWGDKGASCMTASGELLHSDALQLEEVVDSRAAGDVFNAAWIHAMLNGQQPRDCLRQACELAGRKCAQTGIEGLLQ